MSLKAPFKETLQMGIQGEDLVLPWLVKNNEYVEDSRRQKYTDGGGPRLLSGKGSLALPDFVVYNTTGDSFAVDVKSKNKVYLIDGKYYFTVDKKYENYIDTVKIKRLDYLALVFVYNGKLYFYKDSELAGTHQYNNPWGTGTVYLFSYDKHRAIDP